MSILVSPTGPFHNSHKMFPLLLLFSKLSLAMSLPWLLIKHPFSNHMFLLDDQEMNVGFYKNFLNPEEQFCLFARLSSNTPPYARNCIKEDRMYHATTTLLPDFPVLTMLLELQGNAMHRFPMNDTATMKWARLDELQDGFDLLEQDVLLVSFRIPLDRIFVSGYNCSYWTLTFHVSLPFDEKLSITTLAAQAVARDLVVTGRSRTDELRIALETFL